MQRPVEVGGADLPSLRRWLSARLDRPVDPPPLDALGYRAARLVASEYGGVAASGHGLRARGPSPADTLDCAVEQVMTRTGTWG